MNPIGKHIDFIRTGNLNALKKLENAGDVSLDRDENGDTLLHHAAKLNRVAVANYLLQFPSYEVDARNYDGETPLIIAAKYGCILTAHELLRNGAHIDELNKEGNSALHVACKNDHVSTAGLLIGFNADVNKKNFNGESCCSIMGTRERKDGLKSKWWNRELVQKLVENPLVYIYEGDQQYLKSKSGLIYEAEFDMWELNVKKRRKVLGTWNQTSQKIDFYEDGGHEEDATPAYTSSLKLERSKSSYDLDKILNTFGMTPTVSRSGSGDTEMTVSRTEDSSMQEEEQSNPSSVLPFSLISSDAYFGFYTDTSNNTLATPPKRE